MTCTIQLPGSWVGAALLDACLQTVSPGPHAATKTVFVFPSGCKVMIDAAVRILSLCDQLVRSTRRVRLQFDDGPTGTMGYLNRMGFFDFLPKEVTVEPGRPSLSGAAVHAGTNPGLVEVHQIDHRVRDQALPGKLTTAVVRAVGRRPEAKGLEDTAFTIFGELIDNVFSHSQTALNGYAALQLYRNGRSLRVAVSDSGLGVLETLRPALKTEYPALIKLTDRDLLLKIFREGLSRHGKTRGCGLHGSATKAAKYRAELDVRLPTVHITFRADDHGTVVYRDNLPLLWGTHVAFNFPLDPS